MKPIRIAVLLLVVLCFSTLLAQEDICTDIIQQAMVTVEEACAITGRNQACYGNISLEATPREGVENFTFEQQGDIASVADVDTIRLRGLDPEENIWGIALMKIQANLPDALPGENVTFLLFGDVEIQNAVENEVLATIEITSNGGINVRTGPSTDYRVAGSLSSGETAIANGRNADGTWLRIQIPDTDSLGWVAAQLVTPAGDIESLSVVDASDQEIPFTPMQAFYFRTGITGTTCAEAPESGLLIQTPEGMGEISLRANDVDIQLGSTAYLQAQPAGEMTISVVEGQGRVTAEGVTVTVPAGTQVSIPVDENMSASGEPSEPVPYDEAALQTLPVDLLPEAIEIAPAASEEDLAAIDDSGDGGGFGAGGLIGPDWLEGMDIATFCSLMDEALAQGGMTRADYLELLRQAYAFITDAEVRAQLAEVEQVLGQCP